MQIAALPHIALNWRQDGDPNGRPVVFANSLGTDLRLWDKIIPKLPQNLRLIRFDNRGHGLSDGPDAPYSIDDLTLDAEALLDHLRVTDCVFVGLSIGGMIGQSLTARRPDLVRALVLSNTAAKMGDAQMWHDRIAVIQDGGIEALADPILERWFSNTFRATDELAAWRNMLIRTPKQGYLGCCHAIAGADLTDITSTLTLPSMGISGEVDGASTPELVAATLALIPGSTHHVIDNAGHLPCIEDPATYAALLNTFLQEVGHV